MLTKLLSLLLIVTVNISFTNAPLHTNRNLRQALRPAAHHNGGHEKPFQFTAQPSSPMDSRGEPIEGATTTIITTEGVVDVNGVLLVAAGDTLKVEESLLRRSSAGEKESIPVEFEGGPLDVVHYQFLAYHIALQRLVDKIPGLTTNKYIEFNTDFLPDFDPKVDSAESPQKRLVEAVLEAVAHRIVQYKRDGEFGWQDDKRIYIDFVSRKGNAAKNDAIKELFATLRVVKEHKLDELMRSAPVGTEKSDKIIITYTGDTSKLEYPSLFLQTELMSEEKIMAYAVHTIIDLAVVTLTIDRTATDVSQEPGYAVIKELFRYMLKDKVELTDELLARFLSNNPEVAVDAARLLALPPVEEVDFEAIEDIYRMTVEAAKWA